MRPLPDTIEDLRTALQSVGYIADEHTATLVFLACKMGKPLLIEGPAGVGKTEIAKVIARLGEMELIRLQCYEGLDESKALYEWEYGKQLLYTQILKEKVQSLVDHAGTLSEALESVQEQGDVFFRETFLVARPLLKAIRSENPVVLLIDEVDKSDAEFEAFLLEILSDFTVSIPEIGTMKARTHPLVFLTSNEMRELSEALKRRCLYLYIEYPDAEKEAAIIATHFPDIGQQFSREIAEFVGSLRQRHLRKPPSIAEALDWARALTLLHADSLGSAAVKETLGVLLKHQTDLETVSANPVDAARN